MNIRIYILLLLVFAKAIIVNADNIRFEQLSIQDGLSQVCVNSIIQDENGYMWFATNDGLNRFDGYEFTVYKPNSGDKHSLSNNAVKVIYEDSDGIIWIGTAGGGLSRFDVATQKFTSYMHDPFDKKSISNNDVYAIFEDTKKNLWIGTYGGGLNIFDRENNVFKNYVYNEDDSTSISGNAIRSIAEDHDGNIWIGVDEGGLNLFNPENETFTRFVYDSENINSISSNVIMNIYVAESGDLWIGTYGGGFNVFNPETKTFKRYKHIPGNSKSLSNDIVWCFYENNDGTMWIGTRGGGLNVFDPISETFHSYRREITDPGSISGNNILSIVKDKSGVIWLGTEAAGLNKIDLQCKDFGQIGYKETGNSLSNENVFSIYEDENNVLWVGTRGGGLNEYNPKTKQYNHYPCKSDGKYDCLNIISFSAGQDGIMWLGTDGDGFFKFNKYTKQIQTQYKFDPSNYNTLSNNAVSALHVDSDNILWIGTYGGGLNKFNIDDNKFRNIPIDNKNFMKNVVWTIYEDSKGILWIGTGGKGLMRLDKKTDRYVFFENDRDIPTSISNNVVLSILESKDGTIWVGTGGGGLNKFDRNKGAFKAYTQKEGLTNDMVLGILEDENGYLWLSTYNGLSRFDPKSEVFTNYYETDGLQGNSFNERACYKSKSGQMYFGGANGITYFNPNEINDNDYVSPIALTDFKIFNKSVGVNQRFGNDVILKQSIETTDNIVLSYKHNVFSFEFASLHFAAPNNNKYKYKMEGFDDEWIVTDASKRFATYTNLSGGEYVFKVKGTNNDGVWNEQPAMIKITVIPPFWKTSWFYSILIIVALISVYLFIKIRERQLIKDKNRLEHMVEERTQEINQQKEELQLQSELLEKNNEELSRNNRLIKDSISYAKRIQEAMLPADDMLQEYLPDSFVFYRPKDIVSGDFYWFSEQHGKLYIAAADCTGHGVPGAFMSMIGTTLLNEIIIEKKEFVPSEILEKLNTGVIKALNQHKEGVESQDDGMDITICCVDKNKGEIDIACANHTVYVIDNDELRTIQGDVFSIGGIFSLAGKREYTNHKLKMNQGMMIYMFSDGFQDQFGGVKNKKFLASNFKELLFKNRNMDMTEQIDILNSTFDSWKGSNKQVDDILVMGIRL